MTKCVFSIVHELCNNKMICKRSPVAGRYLLLRLCERCFLKCVLHILRYIKRTKRHRLCLSPKDCGIFDNVIYTDLSAHYGIIYGPKLLQLES